MHSLNLNALISNILKLISVHFFFMDKLVLIGHFVLSISTLKMNWFAFRRSHNQQNLTEMTAIIPWKSIAKSMHILKKEKKLWYVKLFVQDAKEQYLVQLSLIIISSALYFWQNDMCDKSSYSFTAAAGLILSTFQNNTEKLLFIRPKHGNKSFTREDIWG